MGERSQLRVEGNDDKHAIVHLLARHGIDCIPHSRPDWVPAVEATGGKDELLRDVELSVRAGSGRAVGFVLDANSSLHDRWQAVSVRLRRSGVDVPKSIPSDGFVGDSPDYRVRVGVWFMPDNKRTGQLEHFLETLVKEGDPILPHARTVTNQAKHSHGAVFPEAKLTNAVLHAWLAWQKEPGLPFGTAIRAKYFRHDARVADKFVRWFRRVFELESLETR